MASYTISDGANDTVPGTSGADSVTGTAGGIDTITLGGGDDFATINQFSYYDEIWIDDPVNNDMWVTYEFFELGLPLEGTVDGGTGTDTLTLGFLSYPMGLPDYPAGVFSLKSVAISGFEILEALARTEISVAQLSSFNQITGINSSDFGADLLLFGPGGTLDFASKTTPGGRYSIDASALTSGLTYKGTSVSDRVVDSPFSDMITGGAGDDVITHSTGADKLDGGSGFDRIRFIWSETAPLVFDASLPATSLADGTQLKNFEAFGVTGGVANDTIIGGVEADELFGGAGADLLSGGDGNDTLYGESGNDTLDGCLGIDRLDGGGGADIIHGGDGNDTLDGGIETGDFRDQLFGGNGNDSISASLNDDAFGGAGDDTIGAFGFRSIYDGFGTEQIHGGDGNDSIRTGSFYEAHGDGGDDFIQSDSSKDVRFFGGAGNDRLQSWAGDDLLDGGSGIDIMRGNHGDDTYVVDNAGDVVFEEANKGTDTVKSSFSYVLGDHVENLTLTGGKSVDGWGNALANVLTGNEGDNRLNGLAGADTMIGGAGNDTYFINMTGDTVVEVAGGGVDAVNIGFGYVLQEHFERLTLTGAKDAKIWGSTSSNVLSGNSGDNWITGRGGSDLMQGGEGADTFRYVSLVDSNVDAGIDRIDDFNFAQGDRIDVSAIDAVHEAIAAGNQAFTTEIASGTAFSAAGQFRFTKDGATFLAEFNTDNDAVAELAIRFLGADPPVEDWFIL